MTVTWSDGGIFPGRPPEWPAAEAWPFSEDGGQLWIGTEGKLTAGVYSENPRLLDAQKMAQVTASPLAVRYPRVPGGVYAEFLTAITGGGRTGSAFVDHATGLTEMVLLGCLAQRSGAALDVDLATGRIVTQIDPGWITPAYRRGYTL